MRTRSVPTSFRRLMSAVALGGIVAAAAGACSSNSDDAAVALASLSGGCVINTDCNSPLVCAFRRCHTECTTSRDCPMTERCVESDRPFHVCQLPTEKTCKINPDCPVGQVCGADSQCRDQCSTNRDCLAEQQCVAGTCADTTELTPDAGLIDAPKDSEAACALNSDCPVGKVCHAGSCVVECRADVDCDLGASCQQSRCVLKTPVTPDASVDAATDANVPECRYNSDCATGVCVSGVCGVQCKKTIDCPSGSTCQGNACVADVPDGGKDAATPDAACTLNSDCPKDSFCVGGQCGPQCKSGGDCPFGFSCSAVGQCVPGVADAGPDGSAGSDCNLSSQCAGALVCKQGKCVPECKNSKDCDTAIGQCCTPAGVCVGALVCASLDGGTDGGPDGAPDAGGDGGKACAIDFDCDDGLFCNGAETCYKGQCVSAAAGPCQSLVQCVEYACDEAKKSCGAAVMTVPNDSDGDGHKRIACGGDDCNDNDATVYTGAIELCDSVDNDCNGIVDDGAVRPRGLPIPATQLGAATSNAAILPFGAGWVEIFVQPPNSMGGVYATIMQPDGSSLMSPLLVSNVTSCGTGTVNLEAVAAGSDTFLAIYDTNGSCVKAQKFAAVYDKNLKMIGTQLLMDTYSGGAAAVWTGSEYFIAYGGAPGYNLPGYYATISTSGAFGTSPVILPTKDGKGFTSGQFSVAVSAGTRGLVYRDESDLAAHKMLAVGVGGTIIAGPLPVVATSAASDALVAVPGGFLSFWRDFSNKPIVTSVGFDAKATGDTVLPVSLNAVSAAAGATDTQGTAVLFHSSDALRLLFLRNSDPTALDTVVQLLTLPNGSTSDVIGMNTAPAGFAYYYWADGAKTVTAYKAGCP